MVVTYSSIVHPAFDHADLETSRGNPRAVLWATFLKADRTVLSTVWTQTGLPKPQCGDFSLA